MNVTLKIYFWSARYDNLCFRHAVSEASSGANIELDATDEDRFWIIECALCKEEEKQKIEQDQKSWEIKQLDKLKREHAKQIEELYLKAINDNK